MTITLRRWPAIGFAGAWFFVILAPTSSIFPVGGQPMAEHRMYLPLAAVISLVVLGLYAWIGRRSLLVFVAAAIGLGWLSIQRNQDYRSRVALWGDTVTNNPNRLKPDFLEARINLASALSSIPGRLPEAIAQYQTVLRANPASALVHNNLGYIYISIPGRSADAIAECQAAVRIQPGFAEAHYNLSIALLQVSGRLPEAIDHLNTALRIRPDFKEARQLLELIRKTEANKNNHRKNQ
jgi:tetratricopeptide (TPR) repeat protein